MVKNKDLSKIEKIKPLLKILADENRLKIITLLKDGELCVCNIYEALNLPQNLVSHHLQILRNAGLVQTKRKGNWVFYELDYEKFEKVAMDLLVLIGKKENV